MRCLVTGAAGFVGRHLVEELCQRGHRVTGTVHPQVDEPGSPREGVELVAADILEGRLDEVFALARPDWVFHLAAFSNPQDSRHQSRLTLETNILGSHNVLHSAREHSSSTRVLLVGSAQQYGRVDEKEQPIAETRPMAPLTPYAVSKASQELLGRSFHDAEGLPVLMTRSFNHTGPGQSDAYVCSSFARQVAEIELGRKDPTMRVGNLAARRDFTDVRDVASAYIRIVESGKPGTIYNVCRGEAFSIEAILESLRRRSRVEVTVVKDPDRVHALDAPLVLGNNERLVRDTGWHLEYALDATLGDLLADWRGRLGGESR